MLKYSFLKLPSKLKKSTKQEVFEAFLNLNFRLWNLNLINKKLNFKILETVLNVNDSNELTWAKLWAKTGYISSVLLDTKYAKYMYNLKLEQLNEDNINEFYQDFIDIYMSVSVLTNFKVINTMQMIMNLYSNKNFNKNAVILNKNIKTLKEYIHNNINNNFYSTSIAKIFAGEDFVSYVKNIDYEYILIDVILHLYSNDENISKKAFEIVIFPFFKNNLLKKKKLEIINGLYNKVNEILNNK